jgi:glycosyltransferase involved in cell wall biosynthesis
MNNYEVTIGIPIYNAEKYIQQCLESALAQTFDSIEFLVIDDCGTDCSMEIVCEYQQVHPRGKDIRIVRQPDNLGIGQARNRILDEALGKYLYFMDADDTIEPDTIEKMLKVTDGVDAQVVMASYQRVETFHEKFVTHDYILAQKVFSEDNQFATYAFHRYGAINANIWNVLLDLAFIRKCGLRFVDTNFWEDLVFKYELATYVSRVVLLPDVTYHYNCHEHSLSNFQYREKISKDEILQNIATIDTLKKDYKRLLGKSYFSSWLTFVLDTDFYMICNILKKRKIIYPRFNNEEIQIVLYSPLNFMQTVRYGNIKCCIYKLLTILPAHLMIKVIYIVDKIRHY